MPTRFMLAATALAALVAAAPAAAQVRATVQPRTQQPVAQAQLHQPTNFEMMARLNEMTERIDQLTAQVEQLSNRLGALNNHVASVSGGIGELRAQEQAHYLTTANAALATCGLLYLHHWQVGSAAHAWRSSDYCGGHYTDNGLYNTAQ